MVKLTEKEDEVSRKIVKNAFILCLVFFITFTAYDCLSMLQSTLNHKHGIGVVCQATVYGCYCISSLLLPKYCIKKLGCKLTLVLSMSLYLPYIASNLYPHWSLMVPTAVFNGLSASLLWGAQCQYLNELAAQYTALSAEKKKNRQNSETGDIKTISEPMTPYPEIKFVITDYSECDKQDICYEENKASPNTSPYVIHDTQNGSSSCVSKIESSFPIESLDEASQKTASSRKDFESTTARFFGIHGFAYLSTHMWSNVMSYFILQNNEFHSNVTLNSSCVCGAHFCNEKDDCFAHNLQEPSVEKRHLLIGLCLALGIVSIIIMALFLDSLGDRVKNITFSFDFLLATGKQLKRRNQILITPLSFYIGMMQGFYTGDFNLSFVGCAWGTFHVALVSACYGAACSLSSPLSGWLVKLTGRIPIITFAALVNVAAQILMLLWNPSSEDTEVFFVLAGLWGTAVGILFSQVKAMYGFIFKENQEAAFGAYHVCYSLGFCLSFAYSNQLCTYIKIYALTSVLILGLVGYLCVEMALRIEIKNTTK